MSLNHESASENVASRSDRTERSSGVVSVEQGLAHDLRAGSDAAAADRSAHRRATWLFEDLLS